MGNKPSTTIGPENVRSDSTPANEVRPLLDELLNNVTHEQWQQFRSGHAENVTTESLCNFVEGVIALCSRSAGEELRFCQDTAVTNTKTMPSKETQTSDYAWLGNLTEALVSQKIIENVNNTVKNSSGPTNINLDRTKNVEVDNVTVFNEIEETETSPELTQTSNTVDPRQEMRALVSQETTDNLDNTVENSSGPTKINVDMSKNVTVYNVNVFNEIEETETSPELTQTSNTVDPRQEMRALVSQETTDNLDNTVENSSGPTKINVDMSKNVTVYNVNVFNEIEETETSPELTRTSNTVDPNTKVPAVSQKTTDIINNTVKNSSGPTNININNSKNVTVTQVHFHNNLRVNEEPQTPIDKKDRDDTHAADEAGTSLENDVTPKKSSAQHEASMQNQSKKCPLAAKDELSQNKEKYRFFVETCMKELVNRVVKKSGKVISLERVWAIYNRLSKKIWATIRDEIDKIPLRKFKNFHKVIFKALCGEWKEPEVVLQYMELNDPTVDDAIVRIFTEEANKLLKKPSRICSFFSSIGRCFRFTRRQNKVDVL
ncbi:unnamed protein product [Oreochromis niloticus]|nr:unnamed protein product [Mustela putorius furo]